MKHFGQLTFIIAQNEDEGKNFGSARRKCKSSNNDLWNKKLNEDISVQEVNYLLHLMVFIKLVKIWFQVPCFGHAGDGNIHVNVMVKDKTNAKEMEDGHKAIEEIFQYVVDLGGTLSGEHGIGTSKAPFMHIAFTDAEMNLFRSIKNI